MGHEIPAHQMQNDAVNKEWVKKVIATYTQEGTVLENVDRIKFLGTLM